MSLTRKLYFLLGFAAMGGLLFVFFSESQVKPKSCPMLTESNDCVVLERVETEAAREKGLSDREDLSTDRGMLFVFEGPQTACLWMKDMNFAVDMVWLNEQKTIVQIAENIRPETYPETFCANDTRYVIELASGVADQAGLRVGQHLKF